MDKRKVNTVEESSFEVTKLFLEKLEFNFGYGDLHGSDPKSEYDTQQGKVIDVRFGGIHFIFVFDYRGCFIEVKQII